MIPEIETSDPPPTLRERAYSLRFDPNVSPPSDEVCLSIGDVPIAARGNLTVLQGKSKVGKSAVVSAILGAMQRGRFSAEGDTLCMEWIGEDAGAIVHLDTEQSPSDWHALVSRSILRSGLSTLSSRLISLPLVPFSRSERFEVLRQTLEFERGQQGGIAGIVVDGIADFCTSPNDEAEALELVSRMMALTQEFDTLAVCVLHENPGSDQGKTRGHLGSELNRKAFANLRIDKDAETSVSTIWGVDMRKRDIPREQGFCFAWDDAPGMHVFRGRAAGLKAAKHEEEARSAARNQWEPIFDFARDGGTGSGCPELTPRMAAEIERDMRGDRKLTPEATMKKRMQRAEANGILRKTEPGTWTLIESGPAGHDRDK